MTDTTETTTPSTALTVTTPTPPAIEKPWRGLKLETFDDLWRFAQLVAKTEFAPKDFRGKPEACFLAIEHGAEVGLSAMQALQNIAVINGRPSIWGDAALALCRASPVCEYVREWIEGDGENAVAICEAKRRGDPEPRRSTFSVADARRAGLWQESATVRRKNRETGQFFEAPNDSPWFRYPNRMLQLRIRGFILRDLFPDVIGGLITAEEARDYPTPTATDRTQPPPRAARPPKPPALPAPSPAAPPSPAEQARLAVSRASSVEELDKLRRRVDQRAEEGVLTASERLDLIDLIHGKVEILQAEPADHDHDPAD